MAKHKEKVISPFILTGQFLGFQLEEGYKLKRIRLATATGEQEIKLSKEARAGLVAQGQILRPGDWIQVWGEQKLDDDSGLAKLKAERIIPVVPQERACPAQAIQDDTTPSKSKQVTVLVCRKSDCMKQGGRSLCHALEASLSKHGLEGSVKIKETGCMKNCKAGPNIVFMPGKAKYSRVRPEQVEGLVTKHLTPSGGSDKS